jgi:DNA polymerase-3 subunit epsilon
VTADAQHRKAEELRSAGARIEILTEAELRARLAGA